MLPLSAAYAIKKKNPSKEVSQKPELCAHGGPIECSEGCYAKGGMIMKPDSIVAGIRAKKMQPAEDLSDEAFMMNEEPEETDDLFSNDEPEEDRSHVIRKILMGLKSR